MDYSRRVMLFCCLFFLSYSLVSAHSIETISTSIEQVSKEQSKSFIKLGEHIIAEFCHCQNLDNFHDLEPILIDASLAAEAIVLDVEKHKFQPYGMSRIAIFQESHISVHTWPESD